MGHAHLYATRRFLQSTVQAFTTQGLWAIGLEMPAQRRENHSSRSRLSARGFPVVQSRAFQGFLGLVEANIASALPCFAQQQKTVFVGA
jgi:hypothetical protein